MSDKSFDSLSGKTLIATPYVLAEGIFHKSLIYMLSHTEEGAMGLIFNNLVNYIELKSFFKIASDKIDPELTMPIYLGGPMEHERGFFLHSGDYDKNLLLQFPNNLALSSNSDVANDIASGCGPKDSLFIIGYTAWKAGQLEAEIKKNLWIVAECDNKFIFADHPEQKWHSALKDLGIDESCFTSQMGNA